MKNNNLWVLGSLLAIVVVAGTALWILLSIKLQDTKGEISLPNAAPRVLAAVPPASNGFSETETEPEMILQNETSSEESLLDSRLSPLSLEEVSQQLQTLLQPYFPESDINLILHLLQTEILSPQTLILKQLQSRVNELTPPLDEQTQTTLWQQVRQLLGQYQAFRRQQMASSTPTTVPQTGTELKAIPSISAGDKNPVSIADVVCPDHLPQHKRQDLHCQAMYYADHTQRIVYLTPENRLAAQDDFNVYGKLIAHYEFSVPAK